jgi:SAM-dependent methyltransferase
MRRVRFARDKGQQAICGDGYHIPFADGSFTVVLLIAMLEHTSEPWRVLAEARRVLKPGGRAIIVVPNDVTMSAGRLVLGKFPIRYPDHLIFTTPGRMHKWLSKGFRIAEEFPLPFRPLPYAVNLYYFMVAEATLEK